MHSNHRLHSLQLPDYQKKKKIVRNHHQHPSTNIHHENTQLTLSSTCKLDRHKFVTDDGGHHNSATDNGADTHGIVDDIRATRPPRCINDGQGLPPLKVYTRSSYWSFDHWNDAISR